MLPLVGSAIRPLQLLTGAGYQVTWFPIAGKTQVHDTCSTESAQFTQITK